MKKVLIVGDVHGDAQFMSNIHACARDQEVKVIVQLGDFGYNFDPNVIASIKAWLDRDPEHEWFWLDGNHDQHDFIENVILKGDTPPHWPVPYFHERMYYCPRGSTTMIGDKMCMFMGGAYSIDKSYRLQQRQQCWWPQEMIRQSDISRAIENAKDRVIDVLFSHDAPPSDEMDEWLYAAGYKVDPHSNANRTALGHLVDRVRPTTLYHGHYHRRYSSVHVSDEGWRTHIEGVGANVHPITNRIDHTAIYGANYIIVEW